MNEVIKHPVGEFFHLENLVLTNSNDSNAIINSYVWSSSRCRRIRLCELSIKNKFYAESLVIYPDFCYESPIFGAEYIKIGSKRYFGAIDFHPITENNDYLQYLEIFPNRQQIKTHIYDLNQFFSQKLWVRRRTENFYNEYQIMLKCFLHQYKKCLYSAEKTSISFKNQQQQYNLYMKTNDPAYGILKSYFGEDFAQQYIDNFLFLNK